MRHRVWDGPTRLFHWLLAVCLLCSYLTAKLGFGWMKWHLRLGYAAMALLLFRLVWGFVGNHHARFKNFVRGPLRIAAYVRRPASLPAAVGHNPLGALMVLFLLLLVLIQTATGLIATDDIAWAGPYNGAVSGRLAALGTKWHDLNVDMLLVAIGVHVAAIGYYLFVRRQNLIRPMITGWKDVADAAPIPHKDHAPWVRALVVALLSAGLVTWLVWAAPPGGSEIE